MYILDTNVVSELRRLRPHGGVLAWLRSVNDHDINLSAVSLGEIQAGIEKTRARDPIKAAEIEAWADQIAETWNVLPMDTMAFRAWAKLMHRRSDHLIEDAMIAATARVHGLRVVTRNVKDFRDFGVELFNPYAGV
jgi:toxin FitB